MENSTVKAEPVVRPLSMNPSAEEQIANAFYRLDAMKRHSDQHRPLSSDKRSEFVAEAISLYSLLMMHGKASAGDMAQYLRSIGAR